MKAGYIIAPPGKKIIFRPYITVNGRRIYPKPGKRVFVLIVDDR